MIDLILYTLGILGMYIISDGLASWWAYYGKPGESFWRNHSLRCLRMVVGLTIIILAGYLLYKGIK